MHRPPYLPQLGTAFVAMPPLPRHDASARLRRAAPTCARPDPAGNKARAAAAATARAESLRKLRARAAGLDAEFRALQEASREREGVRMFNSDEYELDERGLPWAVPMRGRDGEELGRRSSEREGLEGFEGGVLADEDLFSEEEMDGFLEKAREADPRGNMLWVDRPPAAEVRRIGEGDVIDDYFHFREGVDDRAGGEAERELDAELDAEMEREAAEGVRYGSEMEELAALQATYDRKDFEHESVVAKEVKSGIGDAAVDAPPEKEFRKWQAAAEARGGNALSGEEVKMLGPVRVGERRRDETWVRERAEEARIRAAVPPQWGRFCEVHCGSWSGVLSLFDVERNIAPLEAEVGEEEGGFRGGEGGGSDGRGRERRFEERREGREEDVGGGKEEFREAIADWTAVVTSSATFEEDGNDVTWQTTLDRGESAGFGEFSSALRFATDQGHKNSLCPGRAVFADGSFVWESSVMNDEGGDGRRELSIPNAGVMAILTASGVLGDDDEVRVRGVAEICSLSSDGARRHRALFCTMDDRLTHVVSVCEVRAEAGADAMAVAAELSAQRVSLEKTLVGKWRGRGLSFHPYFPPYPFAEMTSVLDFERTSVAPLPQELTYVKEDPSSPKAAVAEPAPRSLVDDGGGDGYGPRKKLSKRVIAAVKRDNERLSRCRLVSTEVLQEAAKERNAWEMVAGGLSSPRLGPRVPDYFSIALPGGAILIGTIGPWVPGVRCRLELIVTDDSSSGAVAESGDRRRKRLIGARSAEGLITGAALLQEATAAVAS